MQNTENYGYHDVHLLRELLHETKKHKYFATPPTNDYLVQRQRGQLEGLTESLYRLNNFKPASNTSYGRTGTYDIASRLGLYNPATSVNVDLYQPKRDPSQKEKDQYQI